VVVRALGAERVGCVVVSGAYRLALLGSSGLGGTARGDVGGGWPEASWCGFSCFAVT